MFTRLEIPKSAKHIAACGVGLLLSMTMVAVAWSAEIVVSQKGKAFSPTSVTARVGDKIVFRNDDNYAHNIFTLSPAQPFDLGIISKGGQKELSLTKPGKLEVECAIHPTMKLLIEVLP